MPYANLILPTIMQMCIIALRAMCDYPWKIGNQFEDQCINQKFYNH